MTPSRADVEKAARTIRAYCKSRKYCGGCQMAKNCHDEDLLPEDWLIGGRNGKKDNLSQ